MALKRIDSGTITCTTTTYVGKIGRIIGTIKKIEIIASASSDFWIYSDVSASGIANDSCFDENILGATGSKITVNTTLAAYPVKGQVTYDNAATDPDQYAEFIVASDIYVSVANVAASDTFRIIIWYEPISD